MSADPAGSAPTLRPEEEGTGGAGPSSSTESAQPTRTSLAALPLLLAVRTYQVLISPMLPPSCKYYPSCSEYAVDALRRFGLLKGAWLTLRRLLRCNPWSHGGVDHVPPAEPRAPAA